MTPTFQPAGMPVTCPVNPRPAAMRELTVYAWVTSAALPAVSVASTVNEPAPGVPVGIAAPSATSPSHVATATSSLHE